MNIIMMADILNLIPYMFFALFELHGIFFLFLVVYFSCLQNILILYFDDLFTGLSDLNSLHSDSPVTVEFVIYLFLYL